MWRAAIASSTCTRRQKLHTYGSSQPYYSLFPPLQKKWGVILLSWSFIFPREYKKWDIAISVTIFFAIPSPCNKFSGGMGFTTSGFTSDNQRFLVLLFQKISEDFEKIFRAGLTDIFCFQRIVKFSI